MGAKINDLLFGFHLTQSNDFVKMSPIARLPAGLHSRLLLEYLILF